MLSLIVWNAKDIIGLCILGIFALVAIAFLLYNKFN